MMGDDSVSTSLQAAYLLHYTEWQESSYIVDAFTLSHGRISMMAKSARASRPQVRALYQPFRPLLLSWVGHSDMRTLTGIEESGAAVPLADAALACGYYINELVMRLLGKDQPQTEVFAHYMVALNDLGALGEPGQPGMEAVLRLFELQLLDALAVLPDLARCTPNGSPVLPDREYRYHPANAIAIVQNPALDVDSSLGIQKEKTRMGEGDSRDPALHADGMTLDEGMLVSGRTLLALSSLDVDDPAVLQEARGLMRRILRVHLGDRPLRSRELFDSLVRRN
ncbi:DNA repair protein RecO [Granulosicoccus sp. 3-233]|uniref:DNA repair protein RecO n=1 Tax=Granulosicoccus sp. 3-233 TaxID=3417969 RepID=UPI003D34796F